jgi:RNA polymerase sigma-70 factor (sigma-E family)
MDGLLDVGGLGMPAATARELPTDRDQAVAALFRAHHKQLVMLARFLVTDPQAAEDLVQDAFVSLYRRWTWMQHHENPYQYLRTSVVNGTRSHLRRGRVRRRTPLAEADEVPSAESSAIVSETRALLLAGLAALPVRQRQVLVLRYYLDLSEAEIAGTLGISRGSVKQHASRGLTTLTARLEKQQ